MTLIADWLPALTQQNKVPMKLIGKRAMGVLCKIYLLKSGFFPTCLHCRPLPPATRAHSRSGSVHLEAGNCSRTLITGHMPIMLDYDMLMTRAETADASAGVNGYRRTSMVRKKVTTRCCFSRSCRAAQAGQTCISTMQMTVQIRWNDYEARDMAWGVGSSLQGGPPGTRPAPRCWHSAAPAAPAASA
jgi:hypothetical protein